MNQDKMDDLEERVSNIEAGNGWHESAKYVLEKLDTLTDAVKDNRSENSAAHGTLHDKMDAQKVMCAQRPLQCQKQFLPARTFGWLIVVLVVLFGSSFTLSGTALKQNAQHEVTHAVLEKKVDDHVIELPHVETHEIVEELPEKLQELEEKIQELHPK